MGAGECSGHATSKRRLPLSEGKDSEEAQEWLQAIIEAAQAGLSPSPAIMKLAEYGAANMGLALRGLELKTLLRRTAGHGSLTTTQRYPHPDVHKITAAGAALSAHLSMLRAPRSLPEPDRRDLLPPVKGAGPQLVPKNDQGPVSDASETGPELRLSPVGTTGFEPATP
ncbi:hypothetical protein [Streptomyces shenzhenensis]|uniref:hypothetical protein n=1 Tax=Streptomyces shenzhenensis TaxID=943815 RepID=UPI001F2F83D8|nr:hypothetical protein [Streptomyces shenzhenensis]